MIKKIVKRTQEQKDKDKRTKGIQVKWTTQVKRTRGQKNKKVKKRRGQKDVKFSKISLKCCVAS